MANLVYSPKDILQKEFKTKMMNGYDPIEVDEFLDNVIKDYEAYNKELLLARRKQPLNGKIRPIIKSPTNASCCSRSTKSAAVTNFDILKRLSNLEREVFGKKLDETPSTPVTPSAPSMTAEPANHDVDNAQTRQF